VKTFSTKPKPPPVSSGTLVFFGVNAFQFTNAKGESRHACYRIEPLAGMQSSTPEQAAQANPNYLMDEIACASGARTSQVPYQRKASGTR
ncbi:MAG: hypothetical protein H7240_06060, partial [Glaciimonas sp.]|nr:hypothetical protein [Glaciimonas sp.]